MFITLLGVFLSGNEILYAHNQSENTTVASNTNVELDRPANHWILKTNLPYWGLVVPNIAVEYGFSDRWSVDIPVFYQPFTVAEAYRFRTFSVQPSLRYYLHSGMTGHFLGFHLTAGLFNIAVDHKTRYQDNGGMYGAGIDYGYAFTFGKRWGLELNIGAGYIYTDYDKYYNIKNGALMGSGTKNYWGLTKFGVSLTYLLNSRRK